jgi:hypothetical protein
MRPRFVAGIYHARDSAPGRFLCISIIETRQQAVCLAASRPMKVPTGLAPDDAFMRRLPAIPTIAEGLRI